MSEHLAETPKEHKYIIRCVLALPKHAAKYIIDMLRDADYNTTEGVKDMINYILDILDKQIDLPDVRCIAMFGFFTWEN